MWTFPCIALLVSLGVLAAGPRARAKRPGLRGRSGLVGLPGAMGVESPGQDASLDQILD